MFQQENTITDLRPLMRLCHQYTFVVYIILVYLASVPTYWWAAIHYTLMQIMTSEAQEWALLTGVPTCKDQSENFIFCNSYILFFITSITMTP